MNAVHAFADAWLLAQAVALMLLTTAILLQRFIRQPLERVRLTQIFLAALLLTMFLIFLPQTPRWTVFHIEATPSLSPTDAAGKMETLPSAAISPNNGAAETLPATARENPLSATASAKFTQHAATPTTAENRPAPSAPRNSAEDRSFWNILRHDGRFFLDRAIATVFAAGVFFFGLQWFVGGRRLRKILHEATLLKNSSQENDAYALPANVRLLVSSAVDAPLVCGVWRPTIVLPHGMLQEARRLAVAHELAHIARRDLLTWRLLGLFAPLIWIQPLYWLLCRRLRVDQDYLADHSAAAGAAMVEDYATVLLSLAARRQRNFLPFPAILSMSDRPTLLRRRIEMLLSSPPPALRSRRLHLFGAATLLGVLTLTLGSVRLVAQTEKEKSPPPKNAVQKVDNLKSAETPPKTDSPPAAPPKSLNEKAKKVTIKVLGPDRKPLKNFPVNIFGVNNKEQVLKGTYQKKEKRTTGMITDIDDKVFTEETGTIELMFNLNFGQLGITVLSPGYAPYYALWWENEKVPDELTIELNAGISVGGIVVDEKGNPIEGVKVKPSIYFKTPRENINNTATSMGEHNLKTDAAGKWRIDYVPASLESLFVQFEHPDYAAASNMFPIKQYQLHGKEEPSQKIVLKTGFTVSGKITNEQEQPIEGAYVRAHRWSDNDQRVTQTDKNGSYRFVVNPESKLYITAKGHAPTIKPIDFKQLPNMAVEDITLKPGKKVRIRIVDKNGKPFPYSQAKPERWHMQISPQRKEDERIDYENGRYYGVDRNPYTDKDGVWTWDDAPEGEVDYSIFAPNAIMKYLTLTAKDEVQVVTLAPTLAVSGKVTDARTGKPITNYKLVPAQKNENNRWWFDQRWAREFKKSEFTFEFTTYSSGILGRRLRLEADGYKIAQCRELAVDEGAVHLDFALEPAKNIEGVVYLPGKKPAKNAIVMLSTKGVEPRYRENAGLILGSHSMQVYTDEQGRFSFPNPGEPFALVANLGHAFATDWQKDAQTEKRYELELVSSRLEGTVFVGLKPTAGVPVCFNARHDWSNEPKEINENFLFIFESVSATSNAEGKFVFDALPASKGYLGHFTGNTWINDAPLELVPGKTTLVRFGLDKIEDTSSLLSSTATAPRPGVQLAIEGIPE